jgi:hypothetical protein
MSEQFDLEAIEARHESFMKYPAYTDGHGDPARTAEIVVMVEQDIPALVAEAKRLRDNYQTMLDAHTVAQKEVVALRARVKELENAPPRTQAEVICDLLQDARNRPGPSGR